MQRAPFLLRSSCNGGVLAACEKAAIEDGAGNGSSVGKGRSVCLLVFLRVSRDQDISDAACQIEKEKRARLIGAFGHPGSAS